MLMYYYAYVSWVPALNVLYVEKLKSSHTLFFHYYFFVCDMTIRLFIFFLPYSFAIWDFTMQDTYIAFVALIFHEIYQNLLIYGMNVWECFFFVFLFYLLIVMYREGERYLNLFEFDFESSMRNGSVHVIFSRSLKFFDVFLNFHKISPDLHKIFPNFHKIFLNFHKIFSDFYKVFLNFHKVFLNFLKNFLKIFIKFEGKYSHSFEFS